eukprot:CAMPEP_0114588614 /NCGR_PEP_ID=MMETSP0125-20121206/11268_1 /TAXON_ID=485358 ORGANISM="Aristerostoma sp., Strain ATCC 50986" /NCGR_SAMPLE_ID=MMETSP0125 /ASSEMBLY_ACC=CAM_ASM_000245 /LENGTH=127 /DNA_ID=CAMNT_0001785089 /DNA_START=789 /DNA_END=1172 /DNA_ORIENTATION=-
MSNAVVMKVFDGINDLSETSTCKAVTSVQFLLDHEVAKVTKGGMFHQNEGNFEVPVICFGLFNRLGIDYGYDVRVTKPLESCLANEFLAYGFFASVLIFIKIEYFGHKSGLEFGGISDEYLIMGALE